MSWECDLVRDWQVATGKREISTPEVARWAIANRKYAPEPADEVNRLSNKLAKALAHEHFTDPQGRSPRLMHAVTNRDGQTKMTFWYDIRSTSPDIMLRALQQRRAQNLADNLQLKIDQDSYNDNYNSGKPIQLVFDYTLDLIELEAAAEKSA